MADKPLIDDNEFIIRLMKSSDYKDRLIGEYIQLVARIRKLHDMIIKYKAGTLDFTPTCPIEILQEQEYAMMEYKDILEVRAQIEKIGLKKFLTI